MSLSKEQLQELKSLELQELKSLEQMLDMYEQAVRRYKETIAPNCDHPIDYAYLIRGWDTCDYQVCRICKKRRSVGSRLWFSEPDE